MSTLTNTKIDAFIRIHAAGPTGSDYAPNRHYLEYQEHIAACYPELPWHDKKALPNAIEPALYFVTINAQLADAPEALAQYFMPVPAEVRARVFLQGAGRGRGRLRLQEHGLAGGINVDNGLNGRVDIFHEMFSDRKATLWDKAPDYCQFPMIEETLAPYIAILATKL